MRNLECTFSTIGKPSMRTSSVRWFDNLQTYNARFIEFLEYFVIETSVKKKLKRKLNFTKM
jgi:hypothetical protein